MPTNLPELLKHADPDAANRVMQAMLRMVKIDMQALEDAHAKA